MTRRYSLPEVCDTCEEAGAFYAAVDEHTDAMADAASDQERAR